RCGDRQRLPGCCHRRRLSRSRYRWGLQGRCGSYGRNWAGVPRCRDRSRGPRPHDRPGVPGCRGQQGVSCCGLPAPGVWLAVLSRRRFRSCGDLPVLFAVLLGPLRRLGPLLWLGESLPLLSVLALLWQIYSRRGSLQIHFRQCGHRCGGSRAMSSRMAWRTAGKVWLGLASDDDDGAVGFDLVTGDRNGGPIGLLGYGGERWSARLARGFGGHAQVSEWRGNRRLRFLSVEQCLESLVQAVEPLVQNEDLRTFVRYFRDIRGLVHVAPAPTA